VTPPADVPRWLAYLHPAWMLFALALAGLALRAGLRLRRARLGHAPRRREQRAAHLRVAKPAVVLLAIGFFGGPASQIWLRGKPAFGTLHAWLGLGVISLFVAAALLGRRIERGRSHRFDAHALLGGAAFLLGALAAVAGFVLLP
jgi:Protein of unknown function (DUF4079)/Eukaryotic cytochrome b561